MSQTILITGASSGIGKATARLFADRGWNVVATMRNTEDGVELAARDNVFVATLDLLDSDSIATAVSSGIERFGAIDVLLNNAGYGAYGPLEATPMPVLRRQFDVNVFGLVETIKAVLPSMRAQGSGVIINVSSVGGRMTFPLGSLYHGSKWAVEGLSEALHFELAALGIRVKLIEPGGVNTDFGGRSFVFTHDPEFPDYQPLVHGRRRTAGGGLRRQPGTERRRRRHLHCSHRRHRPDPLHLRRRRGAAPREPVLGRARRTVRRRHASPVRALTGVNTKRDDAASSGKHLRAAGHLRSFEGPTQEPRTRHEPPWVRWRLQTLAARMESCDTRCRLGSRRRVGTARLRKHGRCGRCVSSALSWGLITAR